jgi:polyhydroxyalkanoate synthesis regulator phasin
MPSILQKIIYNSLGAAAITNEKFKELLEDLIQNSQFTEEEGKRIVDSFLFDLRQQIDQLNGNVQLKVDELLQKLGVPAVQSLKENLEEYIRNIKDDPSILLKLHSKK